MRVFMDSELLDGLARHDGMFKDPSGMDEMERKALNYDSVGVSHFHKGLGGDRSGQKHAEETIQAWRNFESYA